MQEYNVKILVNGRNLDIISAEDLGISFNRIVDDLQDLSASFGDFTYSFDVPKTGANKITFEYAGTSGVKRYFPKTQNLPCKVYNNSVLLLDGVLNLTSVSRDVFSVTVFSKFKEFSDAIDGKSLQDLQFDLISPYNYEKDVIDTIKADNQSSDGGLYVYPYAWYGTQYCQASLYDWASSEYGGDDRTPQVDFEADDPYQNYYYTINSVHDHPNTEYHNYTYHHQIPMQLFMVRVVEQIFLDAGWGISGSFWSDPNVKRMIITYGGDDDVYDKATNQRDDEAGATAPSLNPAIFLPDMEQLEFVSGIIKMFNLYFKVNTEQKIITFNTYNTLFSSGNNPYDITGKVFDETVKFGYAENNDPSIRFTEQENRQVMGDNKLSTGYTTNASLMNFTPCNDNNFDAFFNKVGSKDSDTIDLPFGEPTIKRHKMWNNYDINAVDYGANPHTVFLPLLSPQTFNDNNSMKFNRKDTHTYLFNNESSIKFSAEPTIMYYYGVSRSNFTNFAAIGAASNYYYVDIPTGATYVRCPLGFCSPFQLNSAVPWASYMGASLDINDRRTITGTYLQALWSNLGNTVSSVVADMETDYSLVFDDNGYFHETLWSKFHANKYRRYQNSEIMEAEMRMTETDWSAMQIDRAIKYDKEIYHIVAIEGYSPITKTANIKLIKML